MTREETVAAIKSAFVSVGKIAVKTALAPIPFFNFPIISTIVDFVITKILECVSNAAEMKAFFLYTDFRTNAQGRDFTEKALNYEAIKKTGDAAKTAIAEKELIDSMRVLVKFSS